MTVTATFLNAQPGLNVSDLERAAAFYEQLGFQPVFRNDEIHLVMQKDVVVIHLSTSGDQPASCQIIVSEVDSLYEFALRHKIRILYDGLDNRPWGCRDFTICDPDGNRVTFSQQLQQSIVQ